MITLKEIIKEIFADGSDGITFLPTSDMEIDIKGFTYTKKSKFETGKLGTLYHIMIYKVDELGRAIHTDNFIAVLTDPYVYVSNIIECGFFGVVVKKNKSSKKFMDNVYKKVLAHTV